MFACHIVSASIEAPLLLRLLTHACHCVTAKLLCSFVSPPLQCGNSLLLHLSIKPQWNTLLRVAIKHIVPVSGTSEDTDVLSRARFRAVSGLMAPTEMWCSHDGSTPQGCKADCGLQRLTFNLRPIVSQL